MWSGRILRSPEYKDAIKTWVGTITDSSHVAVTLTMKQTAHHQKIDRYIASNNMRYFLFKINRSIYGNATKRFGKRLDVFAVQETSNWQRLHYHLIIKVPDRITIEELTNLIQVNWLSADFAYNENMVKPCYSAGWVDYMLKKIETTAEIDFENTNNGC